MQTEYMQFLPVSLDLASNTLEYYYSSDSLSRNFDWHLPYKNVLPTKLVLIQTDEEYARYSAEWSDLIMVTDENPNWITLYSGEVTEGEESLLLLNQKATLDIAHPVFDSRYEKAIRGYVEYSTGDYAHFVFTFENTKDGRKYDAWFGREELYPYFEDPSYNEGYQDGLNDGSSNGYDNGYQDGLNDGSNTGFSEGYNDDYNAGYNEGYSAGLIAGEDNGYGAGYDTGYNEGLLQGHEDGFIEGTSLAYQEGFNEGYSEGYRDGQNDSTSSNNSNDDNLIPGDNDDSIPNTDTDTQAPTLSPTENSFNQSTNNIIKINSDLEKSNPKTNSSIKRPNTGASTVESGSSESEWWLGAIFILGLGTLIWLFWPNRQKKSRK